jgi:amino-acid N-acetyltransferase
MEADTVALPDGRCLHAADRKKFSEAACTHVDSPRIASARRGWRQQSHGEDPVHIDGAAARSGPPICTAWRFVLMKLHDMDTARRAAVVQLLCASGLAVDDLDSADIDFVLATDGEALRGVAGLERFGQAALVRSVAVRTEERTAGLGSRLLAEIEGCARDGGIRQLVLLTQTAEDFFLRRGYQPIDREHAPAAVQASAEFQSLCPASARCLSKHID